MLTAQSPFVLIQKDLTMASGPYPKVSAKAWQTLRTRAAAATSTKFTPDVVAAMLSMSSPKSAADNVVYPMRRLGLFAEDGSLTDIGHKWRIDTSYGDACQEILDTVYPSDLAIFVDSTGAPDASEIENWMQHQGFGGSNAKQMAATYVMIAEKKVPIPGATRPRNAAPPTGQPRTTARATPRRTTRGAQQPDRPEGPDHMPEQPAVDKPSGSNRPNVHLDIQIHIPADAGAEQIDLIFASMAKHLYRA